MVPDMKWRADETMRNIEEGSQGGYSHELQEAIDFFSKLNKPKEVSFAEDSEII
jgi:hypothetical protein